MSPPKALKVQLSQAQIREIEAAALLPIAADADCPEIDPKKTPALWADMMQAWRSAIARWPGARHDPPSP